MLTIYFLVLTQKLTKILSTRKKKSQQKKQLSQLHDTLKDFINENSTNVSAKENETLQQQTKGQHNDFERFVDSASQNQLIETYIDDKVRRATDNAVLVVQNRMHDATLSRLTKW